MVKKICAFGKKVLGFWFLMVFLVCSEFSV